MGIFNYTCVCMVIYHLKLYKGVKIIDSLKHTKI